MNIDWLSKIFYTSACYLSEKDRVANEISYYLQLHVQCTNPCGSCGISHTY